MARGRGTRVGVGLELSMNLNKACKSNSACFFKWLGEGWNSSWRGIRIERELEWSVEIEFSVVFLFNG